jgi:hypothetical protein
MSLDRQLVETIKTRFALKSSAQLKAIEQSNDSERWSPEAIVAAGEVLQNRKVGLAQEPMAAEPEESPPPYHYVPEEVALGVLGGLLTPFLLIPYYRRVKDTIDPDLPVPFGPRIAWLALGTTDTKAAATALELREARAATWANGIAGAYRSSVFITPPLADWTLAVGAVLFPPDRAEAFVKPLLERLSRQFGEAQYFCTHQDIELHVWARARKGRLVRGYGWLGQQCLTLWDEGGPTKEERDLGFQFRREGPPAAEQAPDEKVTLPSEEAVMQLASLWSIDPTTLDGQFKEPQRGLLGSVAWAAVGPGASADRGHYPGHPG